MHSVSECKDQLRPKRPRDRQTSMIRELFEDLLGRFEALLELAGLVKSQKLLEQCGLLGWESISLAGDLGH